MTTFDEVLTVAQDAITVKRVYGEPYQHNGVTFIPAAAVRGGVGGGEGDPTQETPGGRGGGLGISARPVGAYQVKGDEVTWVPAADMTGFLKVTLPTPIGTVTGRSMAAILK